MSNFIKVPLILTLATFFTAGLLMVSEELTHERIELQKKELLLKSLQQLIPDSMHDNDLTQSTMELNEPLLLGHRNPQHAYIGTLNDQLSVVAIPVTARDGYSGDIDLMVGLTEDGQITTVKIIEQHETPGLGDLVQSNKSDWLMQFPGKSLNSPAEKNWLVKRDGGEYDQITGATITPRAIVKAIKNAMLYFKDNKHTFKNFINTNQTEL